MKFCCADDPGDKAGYHQHQHQQALPAYTSMPASPILISSDSDEESSLEGCAPEQQQQLKSEEDFVLHSNMCSPDEEQPRPRESPSQLDWPMPRASSIVCISVSADSVSSDSDGDSDHSPGRVEDAESSATDDDDVMRCTPQRPQSSGVIQRSQSACSMQLGTPVATMPPQRRCDERAVEVISLVTPA